MKYEIKVEVEIEAETEVEVARCWVWEVGSFFLQFNFFTIYYKLPIEYFFCDLQFRSKAIE